MNLHEKIASKIASEILSGHVVAGERLPSVREFAKVWDISHVTSANVFKKLESDGLVAATSKGYVVMSDKSDFVTDYHMKRIERAFFDMRASQRAIGYSDEQLADYLEILKSVEDR